MTASSLGTALITGASSGIGAEYADRLARRGYDLVLVARSEARLRSLAEKLQSATGRSMTVVAADLAHPEGLSRVERVLAENSSMTLFVNNAGTTLKGGLLENDMSALSGLIATNVTAPTVLAAAAARAFKARGAGTIINVASVLALAPEMFGGIEGTYSATKSFLLHLSQSLNAQLSGSGVHVQAVLPGATRTEIWAKSATPVDALPPEMVMEAGDLVDAALIGLDSGEVVTIPSLDDVGLWNSHEEGRAALFPHLSLRHPAPRFRKAATA